MKTIKILGLTILLSTAACSDYKVDHGDPDRCLAGQVFKEGVGCVPAGCSQDIHCDDGNPCNGLEECISGRCSRGGVIVESCDDGIGCTNDFCDPALAECVHVVDDSLCAEWERCNPHDDCIGETCSADSGCSDGLYCNGMEKCSGGQCLAGHLDCDDGISCTVDSCSEDSDSCQNVPDSETCPADEICDPLQGCKIKPCAEDGECDDGFHCNGLEECVAGKCVGGLPVICDDRVDCTADRCDEGARGCIHTPDHEACIDDLYCNGVESCDANTGCVTGASIVCRDNVGCTADTCNEELDACQYEPKDENCTSTEICDPLQDCVPRPECQTDDDCPGGMVCRNEKCIQIIEEPAPLDGDDGGMGDDGGDDGMSDDGGDDGYGDDGCCQGDDGGVDACCTGDDGGSMGDDGGDAGADESCQDGSTRPCNTGMPGECAKGTEYCEFGIWTGCQQSIFPMPELCDGLDNDCNDAVDEDVCDCLTGCQDEEACDIAGGEICGHAPGYFDACTIFCFNEFKCPANTDGAPRVCVDVPDFGLGPVCMCETNECPRLCQQDHECYPYGLTYCDPNTWTCTGPCANNTECPLPYLCGEVSGMCECDSGNIGSSCLGCGLDIDCSPPAPCSYRNYETDPGTIVKECEYPCTTTMDCQSLPTSLELFCRWGEGNTANRCACEPETACQACIQGGGEDTCEPYSMDCMTIPDPFGGADDITGCTAPCQNDGHCPEGWYCWDDGLSTNGWCIEASCHCMDVECGPGGIDPAECMMMHPGFECILEDTGDPPIELCSMYCMTTSDCPMGYHCDDGSATGGMSVCRCSMTTATTGRQTPP